MSSENLGAKKGTAHRISGPSRPKDERAPQGPTPAELHLKFGRDHPGTGKGGRHSHEPLQDAWTTNAVLRARNFHKVLACRSSPLPPILVETA